MDIRFKKLHFFFFLASAAALLTSCETSNQKRPAAVPAGATPPTIQAAAPGATEKPTAAPPQKADPVDALIAQAEKEYRAGQVNYSGGHMEAAKANFDKAVDVLLSGPVEIKSNDRLQFEFDKIVEGVNNLEMAALQTGDGFIEQKPEPAPIDEANDIHFPVDPAIKARAAAELSGTQSDLPLVLNDLVASYINYFSSRGRGTFERALRRAGRYREMIQRIFREEGIPQDLIYLAQAESGFKPLALSRTGARGMWQFMASSAVGFGLQRTWWVDDREDPEKATRAAARFLKTLHDQFGDWYLAMAAYDSGAGTVQRAVQRTGYADFWELYRRDALPQETKNYVPIILAVTIMAKNPSQYGLEHVTPDPPNQADVVKVNYPVDLRLAAECIDMPVETLTELNPSLLRMTTPKDAEFELKVPAGTREKFLSAIAQIPPDKRVSWRYHRIAPGETLADLARKFRTTAKAIAEVNNLDENDPLPQSAKLVIPITPSRSLPSGLPRYSRHATRYRVRRGDTVLSVADKNGVPPERIRAWNKLKGNDLRVGSTLAIHRPIASRRGASHGRRSLSRSHSHVSSRPSRSKNAKSSGARRRGKFPKTARSSSPSRRRR